jgi:hypothetical protein
MWDKEVPQEVKAIGKMVVGRRSRLSGAGFKPLQAAAIKSGGRER